MPWQSITLELAEGEAEALSEALLEAGAVSVAIEDALADTAEEVARYERWQRRRLAMKPGLTCLWQIQGRNQLDFDQWMELDLHYIGRAENATPLNRNALLI